MIPSGFELEGPLDSDEDDKVLVFGWSAVSFSLSCDELLVAVRTPSITSFLLFRFPEGDKGDLLFKKSRNVPE